MGGNGELSRLVAYVKYYTRVGTCLDVVGALLLRFIREKSNAAIPGGDRKEIFVRSLTFSTRNGYPFGGFSSFLFFLLVLFTQSYSLFIECTKSTLVSFPSSRSGPTHQPHLVATRSDSIRPDPTRLEPLRGCTSE